MEIEKNYFLIKKPYDVSGKFNFDDEGFVKLSSALQKKHEEKRKKAEIRFRKMTRYSDLLGDAYKSKMSVPSEKEKILKEEIFKEFEATKNNISLVNPKISPRYKKYPYPSMLASCQQRTPMYDFGNAFPWGLFINQNCPTQTQAQDGILGGALAVADMNLAGLTSFAEAGFFIDGCGDMCGKAQVTFNFDSSGSFIGAGLGILVVDVVFNVNVFGFTEGEIVASTSISQVPNSLVVFGQSNGSVGSPAPLVLNFPVLKDSGYVAHAEVDITMFALGLAGATISLNSNLQSIQFCD